MTDRILIGRIKGAHGIRGEVLVTSFAADPEDLGGYGPLESEDRSRTIELAVIRLTPKGVVARVAGIADRTAAEALAGLDLYIDRDRLPEPEPDAFYHADLIGLDAVTADGRILGRIVDVPNYGEISWKSDSTAAGRPNSFHSPMPTCRRSISPPAASPWCRRPTPATMARTPSAMTTT